MISWIHLWLRDFEFMSTMVASKCDLLFRDSVEIVLPALTLLNIITVSDLAVLSGRFVELVV